MSRYAYPALMILFAGLLWACGQRTPDAQTIAHRFVDRSLAHDASSYDIHYRMKYFSDDDTLDIHARVDLVRATSDSIFGGALWIHQDSTDRYYDREYLYFINHAQKHITRYAAHDGQDFIITGNTVGDVINTSFLDPQRLYSLLSDSTTVSRSGDTTITGAAMRFLTLHFADNVPITNQTKSFFFDGQNRMARIEFSVSFQNEQQYNLWVISNPRFDAVSFDDLNERFAVFRADYTFEDYEPQTPEAYAPLATGLRAPQFTARDYATGDTLTLSDYKGKTVVLDFWHKDCYPCIHAIPALSRIRSKYPDNELVVLGMNPFDDHPRAREKLDDFIAINGMNFPIAFVDKEVCEAYNVKAYPTFYVIDPDGLVQFAKVGYSASIEQKLDSLLTQSSIQ